MVIHSIIKTNNLYMYICVIHKIVCVYCRFIFEIIHKDILNVN